MNGNNARENKLISCKWASQLISRETQEQLRERIMAKKEKDFVVGEEIETLLMMIVRCSTHLNLKERKYSGC